MSELKKVLMERDDLTSEEADEQIQEAIDAVNSGEDPSDVLEDFFNLEPDFIFDLL
jgi:hypothetical protein